MDTTSQFVLILLSSSVIAAIVSGVITAMMQKRNEKEQRIFNAKLDAYKEFATHLVSRFTSLTREGKDLNISILAETSAKCLLVSSEPLNKELKTFLVHVDKTYNEGKNADFKKLWEDADKIENLMREDLGF